MSFTIEEITQYEDPIYTRRVQYFGHELRIPPIAHYIAVNSRGAIMTFTLEPVIADGSFMVDDADNYDEHIGYATFTGE